MVRKCSQRRTLRVSRILRTVATESGGTLLFCCDATFWCGDSRSSCSWATPQSLLPSATSEPSLNCPSPSMMD